MTDLNDAFQDKKYKKVWTGISESCYIIKFKLK